MRREARWIDADRDEAEPSYIRTRDHSTLPEQGPTMTSTLSRSCLLSVAAALLSTACSSSIGSGSTGTGASSTGSGGSSATSSTGSGGGDGGSGGAVCQPATLVGAQYTAGAWQTATLDPMTGAITKLESIAAMTAFLQGGSAYDPATKHLYLLGDDSTNHPRVLTIDGPSGATLTTAMLPDHSATNPEIAFGGALFVLHQPSPGTWETATLNAALGTVAVLSPLPDNAFTMSRGFDPSTNHLYEIGNRSGAGNIVTLDATTGAQIAEVPTADLDFDSAVVNKAGQILGLHGTGSNWSVARLDPATGAITNLSPITLSGVYPGMCTYDPCTDRVYQITPDGVLTADGTSGAVISLVPLLGEQGSFATIEAVW